MWVPWDYVTGLGQAQDMYMSARRPPPSPPSRGVLTTWTFSHEFNDGHSYVEMGPT